MWFLPHGLLPDAGQLFVFGRFFGAVATNAFRKAENWPGGTQWYKFGVSGWVLSQAMADLWRPSVLFWACPSGVARAREPADSKNRFYSQNGVSWGGCGRAHGARFCNLGRK